MLQLYITSRAADNTPIYPSRDGSVFINIQEQVAVSGIVTEELWGEVSRELHSRETLTCKSIQYKNIAHNLFTIYYRITVLQYCSATYFATVLIPQLYINILFIPV